MTVVSIAAVAQAGRPPNFVVIFTDDQGYADVGCFGADKIETPHLDRMAEEGLKLTSFYSASPICSPSRAALMTGSYPPRCGMGVYTNSSRKRPEMTAQVLFPYSREGLHADEITIAELLRDEGYATACVGKWHLGHLPPFLPTEHGFDSYFGIPYSNDMSPTPVLRDTEQIEEPADQDSLTERYTEEAVRFIEANAGEPFFLYMPHSMPHIPLHVADRFRDQSEGGLYGDVIEMIDWSVGQVLEALRRLDIDEHTLVVFTSDNGPWLSHGVNGGNAGPLRSGKGTTYEGGMRVPCIAWWPETIPADTESDAIAATIDLLPTFAALSGAPLPERILDGVDLSALLRNPAEAEPRDRFFYYKVLGLEAVRAGDWKLVFERRAWEEYPYRRNLPEDPQALVRPALYHLAKDIGETTNLYEARPDKVAELEALAEAMRADLGDSREGIPCDNCRPLGRVAGE